MSLISVPNDGSESRSLSLYSEMNEAENLMTIKLLDIEDEKAWICSLDQRLAESSSARLKISVEEFWRKLNIELQSPTSSYQYSVAKDKFRVKKVIPGQSGTGFICFCELPLTTVPLDETKNFFIDTSLKKIRDLQQKNSELETTDAKLRQERDAFNMKLEQLTACKLEVEETLQEKFVSILNAKKEKISQLENSESTAKRRKTADEDDSADTDVDSPTSDIEQPAASTSELMSL